MRRIVQRGGMTIVELMMGTGLAAVAVGFTFSLSSLVFRAERRIDGCADAATQAARAQEALASDLARSVIASAPDSSLGAQMELVLLPDEWGHPARGVSWRFAEGRLTRREEGGATRSFPLGELSQVELTASAPVEYRITARGRTGHALTLVGVGPVRADARDFTFWNALP